MASPSHRLRRITGDGSDGWDLFRKSKALVAQGFPVVELTLGEHDIPTDPVLLDEMREAARRGRTGYASIPGEPALREAVARRVERTTGVPTDPGNVVITPGGQSALFATHQLVGDPGDRALHVDPFYPTYPGTIRAAGLVPVAVTAPATNGFQLRESDLRVAARGARSLLVNSPNNPTGVVYSAATLEGIAAASTAEDLWVVSDEVYDSQVWDGRHLSIRSLPGMAERTLVVGSLSKSHAMTGSRLGWIVGPEAAIALLGDLSTVTNYGIPGFIQEAGILALGMSEAYEALIAAPFGRRRLIARRLLERQDVVRAGPMARAMYAMLDVRATGLTGEAFAHRLLDEERIAVMPGESFGAGGAGHVRVALTVEDGAFEEAFARLLALAVRLAAEAGVAPGDPGQGAQKR